MNELLSVLGQAVAFGTPILLAALGEVVAERAGVVNLGVEGMMALGALAAFATAQTTGNLLLGLLMGVLVGALAAAIHALVAVTLRANQFVSGLALTALGLGVSGLLGQHFVGSPLLEPLPGAEFRIGAVLLAIGVWGVLYLTQTGLILRSVGENPGAVDVMGISVVRVRWLAVLFGGAMAGLAGSYLSLSYRPAWVDGTTAGLGWIAVALTIFVGWHPVRAILGAFFFGLLYHLAFRLQGRVPSEFLLMLPYLLVVVVLSLAALRRQQGAAPEALGLPYKRGER
ncbi:MAG: ABC transporter permease [Thermaceae bacterium]|nr:ABC transporter permease [Thermaceae bacterium]